MATILLFAFLALAPCTFATISKHELKAYTMGFFAVDLDKNGRLNRTEFAMITLNMGMGKMMENAVDFLMGQADSNDDGKIDLDEFITMMMKSKKIAEKKVLNDAEKKVATDAAFKAYDKDNNGLITAVEMLQLFPDIKTDQLFMRFDLDGDGQLNYNEFTKCVNELRKRRKNRDEL